MDDKAAVMSDARFDGEAPPVAVELSATDADLLRNAATMLTDLVPAFADAVALHIHTELDELPRDEQTVKHIRAAGETGVREILSTLRARIPPSAHETPTEALEHVRFFRSRGVGWTTFLGVYQYGVAMLRCVVFNELESLVPDEGQRRRIRAAVDEYMCRYVERATTRLGVEYGLLEHGWRPVEGDPILSNPASAEAARRFRETQIARGEWLPASPELSSARQGAEQTLEEFVATIESAAREGGEAAELLAAAGTKITITLADEPDLSVTVLLDREPMEVVEGVQEADGRLWIASVDLRRIWLRNFYLPMAITRGRVRMDGDVRGFLRVVPILRTLHPSYHAESTSTEKEQV